MNLKYLPSQSPRRHHMKILICPSGFKESLAPEAAADYIEAGILRALPSATIVKAPLVDGGEGFVKTLVATTDGVLIPLTVTGPTGEAVLSHFGFLGGNGPKTAVIEMAAAAGLRLVPRAIRNPSLTTTYGVGELIVAALQAGAKHILIGCGDSGTCDGGIGMAQALGVRFTDKRGDIIPIASGGQALTDLAAADLSAINPLLQKVAIDVACNWENVLCGRNGVARVFGPQKGATEAEVERLSIAMDSCARVMSEVVGRDIAHAPGSGSSGGLGAALMLIGARLHPRYDIITEFLKVDELLDDCDLVFTAEGCIDSQTPHGKIPAEVAIRAKKRGLPVIALAGSIGQGADANYDIGIDAFASIMQSPTSLDIAIAKAEKLLVDSAESAMRIVMVGRSLEMRHGQESASLNALQCHDERKELKPLAHDRPLEVQK